MSAVRIINALFLVLGAVFGISQLLDSNEGFAFALGQGIAFGILIAPFALALRALSPRKKMGNWARAAVWANSLAGVLALVACIWLIADDFDGTIGFAWLLPISLPLIFAINIREVRRRNKQDDGSEVSRPQQEMPPMRVPVGNEPEVHTPSTPDYFLRHWRGELSLGRSYWINGSLIGGVLVLAIGLAVGFLTGDARSLRVVSMASAGYLLFAIVMWLWSAVGIWRSAEKHVSRGGQSGWATAAKVAIVIGALGMANNLSNNFIPQIKEYVQIAVGSDPLGNLDLKVSANGQSLLLTGVMREGSATRVEGLLDAAPSIRMLVLNSSGGRIHEARQIAGQVRVRQLATYVEEECASACTYVFLAGSDRAATPSAKIGFHLPSQAGMSPEDHRLIIEETRDDYQSAGVSNHFIDRILKTASDDMWYPSRDELISANVVTRTSLGGEAAIQATAVQSEAAMMEALERDTYFGPILMKLDARFPGTLTSVVKAAWAVRERGGNDGEMMSAARSVISARIPELLSTANDEVLLAFSNLALIEMTAARSIGIDACVQLMNGTLNISQTLGPDILEQDRTFLELAVNSPPRDPSSLFTNSPQEDQIAENLFSEMSPEHISYLSAPDQFVDQPQLGCDASIELLERIAGLPLIERALALRMMHQSTE